MIEEREKPRPFLDFYGEQGIVPVSQDLTDLARHFERRAALYRHCGLPPAFVAGRRVLEIGPGTGHNAVYTLSLKPARYVLLDGNPSSLTKTRATLAQYFTDLSNCELIGSDLHDYDAGERFDLVLCEGVLPTQKSPQRSLQHISRMVAPGGMLLITCIDSVSWLSELLRLVLTHLLLPEEVVDLPAKLDFLRPLFTPHLETLPGRSRPVDEWIQDNLLQPLLGQLLSMEEAISTLQENFEVYGSSPHFLTDWRWYKEIHGRQASYNQYAIETYRKNLHNLLDYRYVYPEISPATGTALQAGCQVIYEFARSQPQHTKAEFAPFLNCLRELYTAIRPLASAAAEALAEYLKALESYRPGEEFKPSLPLFRSWFGRGQQYLSFLHQK